MVAIVAGQGLGLLNTSLGLLGAGGQLGVAGQGRSGEGVYVNASNGNLVVQQQDEWLVGLGPDAGIVRTYNSQGTGVDDNGDNWQLGLSRAIVSVNGPMNQAGSTVVRRDEDGVESTYTHNGVAYVSLDGDGAADSLTWDGISWVWRDGDTQALELYEVINATTKAARLVGVADRNSQVMWLEYTGTRLTKVSTANGDYLEIAYETGTSTQGLSKANNIKSVTTFYASGSDGSGGQASLKRVNYTYDEYNRLKEVIVDLSPADKDHTTGATYTTTYAYDGTSKRILTLTQSDGSVLAFTYEGDKVKTITDVRGSDTSRVTTFTYDTAAGKVSIQDALGQVTELFYETAAGQNQRQLKQIKQPPVNGTRPSTTFTYDAQGNVTKVVDENNRETVYRYDLNGNRVYERNAQGNVIERVYSGTNLLLQDKSFTVNDPDGNGALVHSDALTQHYVHDTAGNLRFVVSPAGNVTEYKYDAQGRRTSQLSYPAHTFDVSTLNLVQADFTSGSGTLGTLPASFIVTGGKLQITSTNQTSSAWVGASTAYQLMGTNWKAEITLPATAAQANAHLLMQAGIEGGTMGSATYRRHFLQISSGFFYADVYNGAAALGRRQLGAVKPGATYVLEILTTADGGTTLYVYEKGQERSTGFVDTRSLTNWTMGSNGLLAARYAIQGYSGPESAGGTLGATVNTLVDNLSIDTKAVTALEQWASSKQASVQRTDYGYDVRGQLDRQTAFASVDANGNGVSDGNQAVTQYVYDQSGNLLQKIDGRAEQIVTSDSTWAQQARQALGYAQYVAQLSEADKVALRGKYVTTHTYDGLNRITTSKDPSTGQMVYTAYADGNRQTLSLMPNGVIATSTYDQAGRLLTVSQAIDGTTPLGTTSYIYDKLGRLTSVTYPTGVKRYFVYDTLGRKVGEIDGEGALTEYQYDAAGQPTRTTGYATKVSATMITALLESKATLSMNMVDSSVSTGTWIKGGNAVDTSPTTLLAGESSRTIEQAAGGAAGESNLTTVYLDVGEGKRYDVSAYTGALNATATLKVEFYNGTTLVGSAQVLGSNAAEKAGGVALADYKRLQGFVTAPAGATKMRVIVVKSTSTNTTALSRLTITRPVVALADAAQTTASLLDLRPAKSVVNDRISWNIYDDAGRLSKTVTSAAIGSPFIHGSAVEYRYDGAGRLVDTVAYASFVLHTDMNKLTPNGAQFKSGGDGVISVTGPAGATSTITLIKDGLNDRRTRYFYDANGRQVGVLDAENYYSESQYDSAGRLVRTTRYATALTQAVAEGATSVPQSYITAQSNWFLLGGSDHSTYYFYNAAGQLKTTIDAEQYVTAYEYDPAGNKFKETRYALTASTINSAGAVLLGTIPASKGVTSAALYVRTSANDRSTTFQYDGNQRLIRTEVQPSGLVSTFQYDEMGNLSTTVVALGQSEERSTQKLYDKLGRLAYELSGVGNLKLAQATTPAAQQAVWNEYATRYEYAAAGGHLIAKITPNGTDGTGPKIVYYYDEAGRVTHSVNALGEVLGYVYNAFGDVTEQRRYAKRLASPASYGGGLKNAVATVMGNLVNADEDAVVRDTYSRQGLLVTRQDAEGAITQTYYNAFNEKAQIEWSNPLGTQYTMYTYERRGLLQSSEEYGAGAASVRSSSTTYDAFGRAKVTYDRNGATRNHYYDRLGRDLYLEEPNNPDIFVTLKHDAFGRISTFTDAQGQATTYTYNDTARTMTVTVGGVSTVTTYDRLGQSVQVSDGRGNLTKYSYDKDGRLTGTGIFTSTGTAVEGTASTTEYDKAGRVYKTTDERGIVTTVTYDKANRVLTHVVNEGGLNLTSEYRYDALGNTAWSKDAAGVWTQTTFNRRGQVTLISVDPTQVPAGTVSESNPFGLVANPAGTNALNLQTQFQYNADGSVYRVTKGLGSSRPEITEYRYDDLGRREKEILDPTGTPLTTTYTYDNADQVVARTDALGRVTRYVYNASGKVTHVIDATGAVVRTDYDVNGRVSRTVAYATAIAAASLTALQVTEAQINALLPVTPGTSDQVTYNVYDARGQLTWTIDALGYATQREHDKSGNVARVTRYKNKPQALSDTWEMAGRPTYAAPTWSSASQADDKVVDQYVYDEANRLSWHVDAMGYATQTQYTDSGRTVTVTRYGKAVVYPGAQTLLTIGTQAPKVLTNAPSPVTEPYVLADSAQDQATVTKLDAAGRVSTVQDALGNITLTEYDAAGRVKLVTVASNDVQQASKTQYVYDKAGRLVEETRGYGSADAATTRYVLDALGQRTAIIDPRGIELAETNADWALKLRKDKGGAYVGSNGEAKSYADLIDSQKTALRDLYTTRQTFDAAGRLKTSTNPLGGITTTDYDAAGNVVKVTAPDGGVGYFAYNANNKATWHIDPMGYATQTFYNALGQVDKIVRYDDKVKGTAVAGQEPKVYATQALATAAGATFYQLETSGKDAITSIEHDLLGRQTTITDAENKAETIAYDDYGNKKTFTNKLGGVYTYTYDKLGRMLTETLPVKVKQYNADGSLKTQVVNGASTTDWDVVNEYTYDSRGNRLTSKEGKNLQEERNTTYTYDQLDRLKTTTGEAMGIFTVADGTQTNKSPTETRNYDKRGNLIEVIDPNGARTLNFWDALNRKTAELKATAKSGTDQTGTLTQYDYNLGGDLIEQRVYGNAVTLPTSAGGTRATVATPVGLRITRYAYDANHMLLKTTVPSVTVGDVNPVTGNYEIRTQDLVSLRSYDSNGNLVKETDARGNTTWHYYDKVGNHVMQVDAERYVRYWTYDASGNVDTEKAYSVKLPDYVVVNADTAVSGVVTLLASDTAARTTSYLRDRLGRVLTQQQQLGTGDAYTVNASTGQLTAASSVAETLYEYDALGSVTKKTESTGETLLWAYDKIGRETRRQGAAFADHTSTATQANLVRQTTDTEYNALNQAARSIERAAVPHDGLAQVVANDDAQDRITRYTYGKNGLLASESDAVGVKTLYEYDLAGNITQTRRTRTLTLGGASPTTSATTDLTTFSYDLAAHQTKQASYNLAGATATWVNSTTYTAIQTLETRYDAFGQITGKRTYANAAPGTDTWQEFVEFDSNGRVTKTNSGDGVAKAYVYDANGNATLKLTSAGANIQSTAIAQLIGAADVYHTATTYDKRGQVAETFEALTGGARDSSGVVKLASITPGNEGLRISFGGTAGSSGPSSVLATGSVAAYKSQAVSMTYATYYWSNANDISAKMAFHIPDDARYGVDAVTKITIAYYYHPVWFGSDYSSVQSYYFDPTVRNTYPIDYHVGDDDDDAGAYSSFQITVEKIGAAGTYLIGSSSWQDSGSNYSFPDEPTSIIYFNNAPPLTYAFNGQPTDATRLLLQYKKKSDANAPWTQISVPRRMVNGQPVLGSFVADQWTNVLRDEYDIRYVALDAQGNVLNSQFGTMVLSDSAPSISQTTPPAGTGHAFLDSSGFINLTELGNKAQTAQIKFREVGTTNWITANNLSAATLADGVATPGWFKFKPTSLSPTALVAGKNYEFIVTTLDGNSAQMGKVKGSFTVGSGSSVSATLTNYTDLPQTVHFQNLPQNAASVRVLYRTTNTTGAWTPQDLKQASPGSFDWDTFDSIVNNPSNVYPLDYELQAFDASGQLLYKSTGKVKVGTTNELVANSTVNTTPATGSLVFKPLAPAGSTPATLNLYYRPAGSTLAYTASASLTVTDGLASFDASSLLPGGSAAGEWDYYYEVFNASSTKLTTTGQPTALTPARLSFNPASRPAAQTVLLGVANPAQVARTSQKVNAFGEIVEQTDALGRVTTLVYNKQGKLVEKIDPATDIVEDNGTLRTSDRRPHTYYHYDLQGRLVGTTDANDYRTTYQLRAAGDGETIVAKEFHLGKTISGTRTLDTVKSQAYDRFGDLRHVNNELSANEFDTTYRTTYLYDKAHRVTQVTRPKRSDQTYAGYDAYAYDEAGNRVKHWASTDGSNTASTFVTNYSTFDALSRVVQTDSGANRRVIYEYTYDGTIKGVNGAEVGGWKVKTKTQNSTGNNEMFDYNDIFGRQSRHIDYGKHDFTYTYNAAGWLMNQSGTTGQSISYAYYADGRIKSITDDKLLTYTLYEYDRVGNKTFEGYATKSGSNWNFLQQATIAYDEFNRIKSVTDPQYRIEYQYDAVGNRRHLKAFKLGASTPTQDYWYTYDGMNRFLVTMGRLDGSTITQAGSTDGVRITYDKTGQRIQALMASGKREDYNYTVDGFLKTSFSSNSWSTLGGAISTRVSDVMGRVSQYINHLDSTGTRNFNYNGDNQVLTEISNGITTAYTYDNDGTLLNSWYTETGGTKRTTHYEYEWWDDAKQSKILLQTNNGPKGWKTGTSNFIYDLNGHVKEVRDYGSDAAANTPDDRSLRYTTNAQGLILVRDEIANQSVNRTQRFFYFDGARIGEVGNDGGTQRVDYAQALAQKPVDRKTAYKNWQPIATADFDQNYEAIGPTYPGFTSAGYTAQGNETLSQVAMAVWGDSSLWYLLADANGLTTDTPLVKDQILVIPNKVTNVHNNSATRKVYNAGEAMGDTSPTLPDPPPPPQKKGCGGIGMILMVVVAIVVTALTAGAALAVLAPGLTMATASVGAVMGAMAIGAAAGSIASQLVGMATGDVQKFSWTAVATSALSAAVTAGVGGALGSGIAGAVASNVVTQGVSVALGLQKKFSWTSVAAAAVGSVASQGVSAGMQELGVSFGSQLANQTVTGMLSGGITQAVVFRQRPDWSALAANSFGSALGDVVVGSITQGDGARGQAQQQSSKPLTQAEIDYFLEGTDTPLSPVYGKTFGEDRAVRTRMNTPDWAVTPAATAAGAPDEEQFDFRRESLRANARSAAEEQARSDFRRSEIQSGNATGKANDLARQAAATSRRNAVAALNPNTAATKDGSITVGDLAMLNAAFDRRDASAAAARNFVGPLRSYNGLGGEIRATPYDWKTDSLVGKITAGFAGDLYGATIGKLTRDDNLSVNPFTGRILSGREEFDARLGGVLLLAPGPKGVSGMRGLVGDVANSGVGYQAFDSFLANGATKGTFATDAKLISHFKDHGTEFGAASADGYLQVGRDIMQNGTKVQYPYKGEIRTGYVEFMGNTRRGDTKFGFVGTNSDGAITTIHTESGKSFWKMLNGDSSIRNITPAP